MTESLRGPAVVVVNYASHELISQNLSIETVNAASSSVFVVDNYSTAVERDEISRLCDDRGWRLISMATNAGFAAAVNRGVREAAEAGCEEFVLLNPDALITGPVLMELAESARREPMALIAPVLKDSSGRIYFRGSLLHLATGQIRGGWLEGSDGGDWRNWLTAACLAFHRQVFDAVGGLSESYFLYWEDVDFSVRAADAGARLVLRTDLEVIHDEGGTQNRSDQKAKSDLYYYYNCRNRLVFANMHLGREGKRSWLRSTPQQSSQIWLRGGRRQLLTHPAGAVAAIRGSLAGVSALIGWAQWPWRRRRREVASGDRGQPTVLIAHPSPDLYGSDRVLLESVSALVGAGSRVLTVLPAHGPLVAALAERGSEVTICPTPVLRKAALRPTGAVRLAGELFRSIRPATRVLRSTRPDFVLVNTVTIPSWLALSRLAGRPVVCHVHEAERSGSSLVRKALYAPLLLADRLLVNSRFTGNVVSEVWPRLRERATLIYNGVPSPVAVNDPREALDTVRILFIGRLSPRKGPQVAIDALAELVSEGYSAQLALLGAVYPGYEWFDQELHAQVERRGLAGRVTFLGFDDDIWRHLAAADIVLVPSISEESFGNTVVESILAKRPVVVSMDSGLREAAAGYGIARLVPPGDVSAIAEAIKALVADWASTRVEAEVDRDLALSRHAPEVYRRHLAEFVSAEMRRASDWKRRQPFNSGRC